MEERKGPPVIMCRRTKDPGGPVTDEALIRKCQECGEDVWLSPSSLICAGADSLLVCIPCMPDFIKEHGSAPIKLPSEHMLKLANESAERAGIKTRVTMEDMPQILRNLKRAGIFPPDAELEK